MRLGIGIIARLATYAAVTAIVVDAVVVLWQRTNYGEAVAAAVFFPVTYLFWPWKHAALGYPLWMVLVVGLVAYPISTFVGGLPPE